MNKKQNTIFKDSPWLGVNKIKVKLSPLDLGFLYSLTLPIFGIFVYLKLERVSVYGQILNPFYLFYSDICFYLALVTFGLGIFGLSPSLLGRVFLFLVIQAISTLFVVLEICAHNYYMTTGFFLNFDLLQYVIANLKEVSVVLGGSTSWENYILLIISIAIVLLGPWLLALAYIVFRSNKSSVKIQNLPLSVRFIFILVSFLFISINFLPIFTNKNSLFSQNLVVNILRSFIKNQSTPEIDPKSLWEPPTHSKLTSYANVKHRNLVLIVLETTRSDATTLYNKNLGTTPYLKELSKSSLLLKNANSLNPHTSKCLTAIHCGIEPNVQTPIKEAEARGIPSKCLPNLLKEVGYKTAWFQVATEHFESRRGLVSNFGYEDFYPGDFFNRDGFYPTNYFGYEDNVILDPIKDWLLKQTAEHPDQPFMLGLLTNISHHYYTLPPNYEMQPFHPDTYKNKYLNTVHYMDSFIKKFMEQYKELGLYHNTVFLFVGDHGEALNEHGVYGHSHTVYRETMQIPLMIHDPLRFKMGTEITKAVFQPDILPTLVYLLDYQLENAPYRGTNFLLDSRDYKLPMNCWNQRDCVAMYNSQYKYIHFFDKRADEMYDIVKDPDEFKNIIGTVPQVEQWKQEALTWYDKIEALYNLYQTKDNTSASNK